VSDEPDRDGAASAEAGWPSGEQDIAAEEAKPGIPGDGTASRRRRRRPNFRGHIVVDDDEPLPVFAVPADPPPAPLPAADDQASPG
jgi:hypothetical protein